MSSRHTHAALFTAIRTLPPPSPEERAQHTTWINQVLESARSHAPGLSASYLHGLIQFCPCLQHAAARRTLARYAERLASAASDPTLPNPVDIVLERADALARLLDTLTGQFAPHPGPLPRTPPPPATIRRVSEDDLGEERDLLAAGPLVREPAGGAL